MANYANLKATIAANIKQNGNEEITGPILQSVLTQMTTLLGSGWVYAGVATPATAPGTPDNNVFYIASTAGTYTNFGGLFVADGEVAILKYNGTWAKDVTGAATAAQVTQLGGINEVLLDNITTQPSKGYITSDMVQPGDTLVFELTSLDNLVGLLKAEKTGYVHDAYIDCPAGQSVTRTYVVPEGFLRIYTAGNYNPMVVTCRRVQAGKIQKLEDDVQNLSDSFDALSESALKATDLLSDAGSLTSKGMNQKAITNLTDSPFAVVVPDALNGIVAFRMVAIPNDPMPVNNYKQFRVSSIYMGGAWNISIQIQASVDGNTWVNYDGVDRLATDAPNPLPVIETIESNTKRFIMVVNWPMMGNISASGVNYLLKKDAPNYLIAGLMSQMKSLDASVKAATDSPFAVEIPSALNGIVAFRFGLLKNDPLALDKYTSFRVSSIYMGGSWNISMQLQASVDGVNWVNYDGLDRLASAAPSPLPVIETLKSNTGRFEVVVNWPKMGSASGSSVSYILKKDSPNYIAKVLQDQINVIIERPNICLGDYELKDRIKQVVKVDASGNGDHTTIAAAYAAITDSSFDNQYEVVVYPGIYNEYNLIPPKFTHTHGLYPNSVIVTSEGVSSTLPVFDQKVPCKLSNMTIISGTGYCVHQDQTTLQGIALVNENLHCKKVYGQDVRNFGFRSITNPAILGIGSHVFGSKFIWKNCVFEDGKIGMHTVGGDSTIPANQHLIYKNCKLVNAYFDLGVAGSSSKVGNFVFEVDGLYTEPGRPSIMCVLGARTAGDNSYNFPWQIIGGNNRNLIVMTLNDNDTLTDDVWPNVNTNDITFVQLASGVSVSKGQFVDIAGNICTGSTDPEDVVGIALEDGVSGGTVRVCVGSFAYDNAFNSAAFPVTTHDGNYGIGSDGRLLLNASTIIGRVKYNNFYRI